MSALCCSSRSRPLARMSASRKTGNLKFRRPAPSGTRDLPRRALDPGPTCRPRSTDFQFLESLRPRHPDSHAGENGATPGRSRARRRGTESQVFSFSDFGGAKVKLHECTPGHVQNILRAAPRKNPFRFRHLGICRCRFGFSSGSGQFRVD
jgi:hypothetical protein